MGASRGKWLSFQGITRDEVVIPVALYFGLMVHVILDSLRLLHVGICLMMMHGMLLK
jgi:hypothetical protein